MTSTKETHVARATDTARRGMSEICPGGGAVGFGFAADRESRLVQANTRTGAATHNGDIACVEWVGTRKRKTRRLV